MILESLPSTQLHSRFFEVSELVVVLIFTVEYITFWILSSNRRTYPFHFFQIVDLLAILPFYLSTGFDFRVLRAIRLLRIFRVLKVARYSKSIQLLGRVVRRVLPDLGICMIITFIVILIASCGIYYAENDAQPDIFSSIPECLWWSIVTLSTVGYGDAVPMTGLGRIFAGVLMIAGIGLIAFPTSFVTSALAEIRAEDREQRVDKDIPPSDIA